MRIIREWIVRLAGTVRPGRTDADMEEELRAHLEMSGRGPDPSAVAIGVERMRDQRGVFWVRDAARDLRYAGRRLCREPGFSTAAIASLALGIGVNAAIFSLVDRVLLRPLPVRDPAALFFLNAVGSAGGGGAPPYPCFERFRAETSAFEGLAAYATDELPVQIDGVSEQVYGQVASGNYFEVLGIAPAAGRLLQPADERLEPAAAVIGYGYWQRRFGGDPSAIGRTITFRGRPFTVVGVTPPEFAGVNPGRRLDLTFPITIERTQVANASGWWFDVIARLRPGVHPEEARGQLDAVFQSFMSQTAPSGLRATFFDHIQLTPAGRGADRMRARFATPLYGLVLVAALVLGIACVNVASLLLVRSTARGREFAVRLAIGAGAGRLVRQSLTETGLLFAAGAAAGIALSAPVSRGLAAFFAVGRSPIFIDVSFDWRVAAFTAIVAALLALATGVLPALRSLTADPQQALQHTEERVAGSSRLANASQVLVALQIAISFVLVVAAVLFGTSMMRLRNLDAGFSRSGIVTMSLFPLLPPDAPPAPRTEFWKDVLDRVRALPGVTSASLSVLTPLSGRDTTSGITVPGFTPGDERDRLIHINHVSEEYFRTFGIGLIAGRAFTAADDDGGQRVIVLNETAVRAYFGGRNPLGTTVRFGSGDPRVVVGVVRDFKHASLREAPVRFGFVPIWQPLNRPSRITLAAASPQPGATLARAVAHEALAVEPSTLVSDVLGVEEQIDATLVSERLLSTLGLSFALLAIGLAALGVYGVTSYVVARRRIEFGIRMALGASPGRIARTVMAQLIPSLVIGIGAGLIVAIPLSRLGQGLLFRAAASDDSIPYLAGTAIITTLVLFSAALPARRAQSIDPTESLRRS